MKKKIIRRSQQGSHELPQTLHPVLQRIYATRNILSAQDLNNSLQALPRVGSLRGLKAAVEILHAALCQQQRILVVGDFDVDGATSCATAVRALRMLGAKDVTYLVPNRFEYGYGLTPEIVAVALHQHPAVIVTVDNGISSIDGVAAATRAGIKVVITDHHLPGAVLPQADAIVNPNQLGCEFPSKNLAGVGVVFYVMLALRAHLREAAWFEAQGMPEPNLAVLLDLVALGTVADVVPFDAVNRILVAQGVARIRQGNCNAGISALLNIAGRKPNRLVAQDLGFAVGPRLNAAGRLSDMSLGIECLLSDDPQAASAMAARLDVLNQERREIESQMQEQALVNLAAMELEQAQEGLPNSICLFDNTWHQGVIGILASRIKDRFHRPVIVFALSSQEEIKGSARSVPGLHIRDALDAVAAHNPGLLSKFGGHAMAAGLTLRLEDFIAFRTAFELEVSRHLGADDLHGIVYSDGELSHDDLSLDLAETLRNGGPWGQGFPEPAFDGVFDVLSLRVVGEKHLKMTLKHLHGVKVIDAIGFNMLESALPRDSTRLHLVYRLDVNEYRGERSPQLIIEYMQPA